MKGWGTKTCFKKEAKGNSEMAFCSHIFVMLS